MPRGTCEPRLSVSAARGFTLLELLVALGVLGMLLVGLAQGTRFGLMAWATSLRLTRAADDLSTTDGLLRRLIEGIETGNDLAPEPVSGSGTRLEFTTAIPDASDSTSSRRMRAALEVTPDQRFLLRWQPASPAAPPGSRAVTTDTVLLRGLARLEFSYWRNGLTWVSGWNAPEPPELIRIRLKFPEGDPRSWPDIVAAPRLSRP